MMDTHVPMFDGSLAVNDSSRLALMYWCKFYNHHVFSKTPKDQPDDFTLDSDILMDRWVEKAEFKEDLESRNIRTADKMQQVIHFDT